MYLKNKYMMKGSMRSLVKDWFFRYLHGDLAVAAGFI